MKKVLFLVAVFALVAMPTFAHGWDWRHNDTSLKVDNSISVNNYDFASVKNDVDTSANTGKNEVEDNSGNVKLVTGDALAVTDLLNQVNYIDTTVLDNPCDCLFDGDYDKVNMNNSIEIKNVKTAFVNNNVETVANTGDNEVEDNGSNNNRGPISFPFFSYPQVNTVTVKTGVAQSQTSLDNVVNTDLTTIVRGVGSAY